jgi:hypothetical protein
LVTGAGGEDLTSPPKPAIIKTHTTKGKQMNNINITVPEIHADILTGFIGQFLDENDPDQFVREAFENIYNQLTEGQ